jgi:hypothetical protein
VGGRGDQLGIESVRLRLISWSPRPYLGVRWRAGEVLFVRLVPTIILLFFSRPTVRGVKRELGGIAQLSF